MSPLQANISAALLPDLDGATPQEKWLNCTQAYPWYPLPWLMLATTTDKASIQKAGLWFPDEYRLHALLHYKPWQEDNWITEHLDKMAADSEPESYEVKSPNPLDDHLEETLSEKAIDPDAMEIEAAEESGSREPSKSHIDKKFAAAITPEHINGKQEITAELIGIVTVTEFIEPQTSTEFYQESAVHEDSSDISIPLGNIEKVLKMQPAEIKADQAAFEPFHSVDYFASQGIRLHAIAEPKDKFDRQVKSFTQWLKTMKSVTPKESEMINDPEVEAQANASLSEKDIITEAMAEVLQKQGKWKKAAETYEKLLLLHPEKSAFFAAQIEKLKIKP